MSRIQIPGHFQGLARQLALRSYFRSKKNFPKEKWFEKIDGMKKLWQEATGVDPSNDSLAKAIALMLKDEGVYLGYVLDKCDYDCTTEAAWTAALEAAGWTVLQMYVSASDGEEE